MSQKSPEIPTNELETSDMILVRLSRLANEGDDVESDTYGERWAKKVGAFLKAIGAVGESKNFLDLSSTEFWDTHALRLGYLSGLLAKTETRTFSRKENDDPMTVSTTHALHVRHDPKKVFVVHGHDDQAKEATARFLEKLGLQPVILHEKANAGRTIIEKFESYSDDIAFAVVLLTPDDVGSVATDASNLKPRARQNVIMELGYFMGRLGRLRVCALFKGDIEFPSDYQGVLYIEMDSAGGWKSKLAQEFVQAKLRINLEALLEG